MSLTRYRDSLEEKKSCQLKSHSEVSKSQSTRLLDFRLNKTIVPTEKKKDEKFDMDLTADNSAGQMILQTFCTNCMEVIQHFISLDFNCFALHKNNKRR